MFILVIISVVSVALFLNRIISYFVRDHDNLFQAASILILVLCTVTLLVYLFVVKSVMLTIGIIVLSVCIVLIDRYFFLSRCSIHSLKKDLVIDQALAYGLLTVALLAS